MRSIKYTITSTDITPKIEKYGGVQGDHNTTKLVFDVTDVYSSADTEKRFRIEYIDGSGIYNTSGHLTVYSENAKRYVSFVLGKEITANGGSVQFNLLMISLDDENAENEILSSYPIRVYFAPSAASAYGSQTVKKGIDGLTITASEAAQRAESAAKVAETEVGNHNTDTKAHEDIRDEVDKLGNSIANSIYSHNVDETSHSDIRQSLISHNTDTTSHQDIRETINTLGSIHVPELIKSHNTDLEAHSDIRADIQTLGNTVIPNMAKSAAADAVNEHNYNATAHEDIRQQRNADMDNLSANIIPGIASAKVQAHNTDETAHSDIREKIAALESDSVPEYWQAELDNGVEAIRKAAETVGYNKAAFFFYTDAHWSNDTTYTAKLAPSQLKYLYRRTPINKTVYGGDIVSAEGTDADTMAYLWDWRERLRDLPNHHSVVGNHDDGNTTNNLFSEQYVYAYLLAPEETPDIVRGKNGLYYYIDCASERTRYIYLDTAFLNYNSAQAEFLKNALLTTPGEWHIVVVSHIWYENDYTNYPPVISGLSTDAENILTELDNYNARSGNYSACTGWVEFCIGGHCHEDYDGSSNGGIPIILVDADAIHDRSGTMPEHGTTDEGSINAIIADYDNLTVNVIRIGRGESRTVALTKRPAVYTNVLPLAVSIVDGTVLTGEDGSVGYINNTRYSSSSGYVAATGWDVAGLMPCAIGDVIRLKNMTAYPYSESTNDNRGSIGFYDATRTWLASANLLNAETGLLGPTFNAEYDEDGNITQFTVPEWDGLATVAYFTITCQDINENSIITVNEPIE